MPCHHDRIMPGQKPVSQREIRRKTHATRHNPVPGIVPTPGPPVMISARLVSANLSASRWLGASALLVFS
jgi:hypothetical protein